MKYRLLCLDLDGTLLDSEKVLRPKEIEAIRRAAAAGARIVLNSARMPAGVEPTEQALGVPCIKICDGGSYILDGDTCISSVHFSAQSMRDIYRKCAVKYQINLWIFQDRDWYVTGMDDRTRKEIEIIGCRPQFADAEELADRWEAEKTGPSKLLLNARPNVIDKIKGEMEENIRQGIWTDISMAKSADFFLEIFPANIDKGSVLRSVSQLENIPLSETAAFGDHEMDIPMIRTAGLGVAMENAVPPLKDIADYITLSNDADGVAFAIDRMLEGTL